MTLSPRNRKLVRAAVDYGGLALFLVGAIVNHFDLVKATWWLVGGSAAGLLIGYAFERRVAPMPLAAGGAALLFGGLTLIFHDSSFIKMKPTIVNIALAAFLLGGELLKRSPLKILMGEFLHLTEAGWNKLTWRYGFYFLAVAILNLIIWLTQPDVVWAYFRIPGLQILALVFSLSQVPLIMKSAAQAEAADKAAAEADSPPAVTD